MAFGKTFNPSLHPDRLFPVQEKARDLARQLYQTIASAPIISPHGHTDPEWFSENRSFGDPVSLLITPDHYVLRMLYSQGYSLQDFGVQPKPDYQARTAWRIFAKNYFLFRGTPTSMWMNHVFHSVFELPSPLSAETADTFFDTISEKLQSKTFLPRSLYDQFKIEVLATTDAATDTLHAHRKIREEWPRTILPTFRPDGVIDPENEDFLANLEQLSEMTSLDCHDYDNYLAALRKRRLEFIKLGATATDHGHPTPKTLNLGAREARDLFQRVQKQPSAMDAENFRAHMLVEMARMSTEDGLVMQLHPGSFRNHNFELFKKFGRDRGADIPTRAEFTRNLKPLLDLLGNHQNFKIILFTLDESTYSRELAPLAGHYPSILLGPAWWFHDSPEGMIRHRQQLIETAGFYNTAGFNDDTRAFFSIPARHDVARRIDCRVLANWVCEHRLTETEAFELLQDLTHRLVKKAYRL